jgi:hypothetical protein
MIWSGTGTMTYTNLYTHVYNTVTIWGFAPDL